MERRKMDLVDTEEAGDIWDELIEAMRGIDDDGLARMVTVLEKSGQPERAAMFSKRGH